MVIQLILYTSDNTNSNTNTSNQNTSNNTNHTNTNNKKKNNVCKLVNVLVHTPRDPVHQTEDRHFLASPWLG